MVQWLVGHLHPCWHESKKDCRFSTKTQPCKVASSIEGLVSKLAWSQGTLNTSIFTKVYLFQLARMSTRTLTYHFQSTSKSSIECFERVSLHQAVGVVAITKSNKKIYSQWIPSATQCNLSKKIHLLDHSSLTKNAISSKHMWVEA
jgi:hypothetical protein